MSCILSSTQTTSESYGFYHRRRKSPSELTTPCLPHSTGQSELREGTRCRRNSSSCISKQPFVRCADVFHADHNLPNEVIYADDADFISTNHEYITTRSRQQHWGIGSCASTSTKRSVQSSAVKPAVTNGERPRNSDPCSETLRNCLAKKCWWSPLSVPCGLFGCEHNTSASNSDCVYITHSCAQCYCTTRVRGA